MKGTKKVSAKIKEKLANKVMELLIEAAIPKEPWHKAPLKIRKKSK